MTKAEHNAELMRRVLRLSVEQYANHVLEEGMRYLDLYAGSDSETRRVLRDQASYWKWWRRAWDKRNAEFVREQHLGEWEHAVGKWERSLIATYYHELHAADMVVGTSRPTRMVMKEALVELRQRLNLR